MTIDEALRQLTDCVEEVGAERDDEALNALRAAVERVRKLHRPDQWGDCPACAPDPEGEDLPYPYPCPTVRALDGEPS